MKKKINITYLEPKYHFRLKANYFFPSKKRLRHYSRNAYMLNLKLSIEKGICGKQEISI